MSAPADIDLVVIGGSAGGIEALSVLLPPLPASFHAAVLVVVHLPRDRPSLLASVFSSRCALPVGEAFDKDPLLGGTITFAPPDYHLLVDVEATGAARLSLSVDAPVHHSRPAIDVLFESVAELFGSRALGVILSGASADGALGLAALRRAGGYAVVQAPESAAAATMPLAAIRAGPVDQVLALEQIAQVLCALDATRSASASRKVLLCRPR